MKFILLLFAILAISSCTATKKKNNTPKPVVLDLNLPISRPEPERTKLQLNNQRDTIERMYYNGYSTYKIAGILNEKNGTIAWYVRYHLKKPYENVNISSISHEIQQNIVLMYMNELSVPHICQLFNFRPEIVHKILLVHRIPEASSINLDLKDKAIEYRKQGLSNREIARRLGIHRDTVHRLLKDEAKSDTVFRTPKITLLKKEKIIEMMRTNHSRSEIMDAFGINNCQYVRVYKHALRSGYVSRCERLEKKERPTKKMQFMPKRPRSRPKKTKADEGQDNDSNDVEMNENENETKISFGDTCIDERDAHYDNVCEEDPLITAFIDQCTEYLKGNIHEDLGF